MLKLRIRGITIPFCSKKKKETSAQENDLENKINKLQSDLMNNPHNANSNLDILNQIEKYKEDLKILRLPKMEAMRIHCKANIYENFEKPSSYFCNLAKRNYINKTTTSVDTGNEILTNQKDILEAQRCFYEGLYSTKRRFDVLKYYSMLLNPAKILPLSEESSFKCEGLITDEELKSVLRNMKNGKTPGSDGFPSEFYKFFWNDIGSFVLNSVNEALVKGELSTTQKQGIITCLPKGDKPRQYLKNWRPISLLNVDYKLLSGVLAMRIKNILPEIISNSQKGF